MMLNMNGIDLTNSRISVQNVSFSVVTYVIFNPTISSDPSRKQTSDVLALICRRHDLK